jgi:hypothetical protein
LDGFNAGFEEDDLSWQVPGPGDSHYELKVTIEDIMDESGDDWSAMSTSAPALSEEGSAPAVDPRASQVLLRDPWYYRGIDSWSRFHGFVALGFGTLSLVGLGFLLVRALTGRPILDSSFSALVVGLIGTIAFVFLSLTTTVLSLLLVDLARNLRRLKDQAERNARIARG